MLQIVHSLFALGVFSLSLFGQRLLLDRSTSEVLRQAVQIEEDEFSLARLTALGNSMLAQNTRKDLLIYEIYVNPGLLQIYGVSTDAGLDFWKDRHAALAKLQWRCAEVFATRRGALLRVRNGNEISAVVLRGENPLAWKVRASEMHLLHLGFSSSPGEPLSNEAHAFVQASGPRPMLSTAEDLFTKLAKELPVDLKYLTIRTIPWFPKSAYFPTFFPYSGESRLPDDHELTMTPYVGCRASFDGPPRCRIDGI